MRNILIPSILALLIAAMALLQAGSPAEAASNILWRDCNEGLECGTMTVPLEHSSPRTGNIELALVRYPALDPENKIGSLVVNFGGPGAPTVDSLINGGYIAFFPQALRDRFDIVGFDPRGVGQSTAVDCVDDFDDFVTEFTPDTPRERDKAIQEAQAFADFCQQGSRALIQHVNTEAAARDMDLIREELGDEKLTFIGFSYGTLLGATYAELFPERVRALVLDGGIATDLEPHEDVLQQAAGFELALDSFFSVCAADPDCPFKAPDLEAAFEALVAEAEETPLPGWSFPISGNEILNAAASGMYRRETNWIFLAEGLRQAYEQHSGVGIGAALSLGAVDPADEDAYTNPYEAFIAVSCVDFWGYEDEGHFVQTLEEAPAAAPHFGELFVYNSLPCVYWPEAERREPYVYTATGAAPILVMGTTRDPATPYIWAEGLAAGLQSGVLLTYDGDGHTAFGYGNECIDNYGINYLIDLAVPPEGTVCDGVYGDTFPPSAAAAEAPAPPAPAPPPPAPVPPAPAAPSGTISPPDTGSGGEASVSKWSFAIGAVFLAIGAFGLTATSVRKRAR